MKSSLTDLTENLHFLTTGEKQVIEKAIDKFKQQTLECCRMHKEEFLEFLGNEDGCVVGIEPYGVPFAAVVLEYLRGECNQELVLTLMNKEGKDVDESKVKGRKAIIVDDDIVSGQTYRESIQIIDSYKPTGILYVTYEDRAGLADIVLKDTVEARMCSRCFKSYSRKYSEEILSIYYCPNCLALAKQEIGRIKRAFRETGSTVLSVDEIVEWINNRSGFRRFSKERAEKYLQIPELFQTFGPGLYRIKHPHK